MVKMMFQYEKKIEKVAHTIILLSPRYMAPEPTVLLANVWGKLSVADSVP